MNDRVKYVVTKTQNVRIILGMYHILGGLVSSGYPVIHLFPIVQFVIFHFVWPFRHGNCSCVYRHWTEPWMEPCLTFTQSWADLKSCDINPQGICFHGNLHWFLWWCMLEFVDFMSNFNARAAGLGIYFLLFIISFQLIIFHWFVSQCYKCLVCVSQTTLFVVTLGLCSSLRVTFLWIHCAFGLNLTKPTVIHLTIVGLDSGLISHCGSCCVMQTFLFSKSIMKCLKSYQYFSLVKDKLILEHSGYPHPLCTKLVCLVPVLLWWTNFTLVLQIIPLVIVQTCVFLAWWCSQMFGKCSYFFTVIILLNLVILKGVNLTQFVSPSLLHLCVLVW